MHNIPKKMEACVLHGYGDFDQLRFHRDWITPIPKADQVLIKVGACGLNNTDINTRTGWYAKSVTEKTTGEAFEMEDSSTAGWGGIGLTFPRIQGADFVGEVIAVGADLQTDLLGRRVMVDTWLRNWQQPDDLSQIGYFGSEADGGFAQYAVVSAKQVHPVESALSDAELATFATSSITAENMLNRAQVRAGDRVLIPGASGGVGSALVQLAKRRGAVTIALADEAKHDQMQIVAADVLLPRNPENLANLLQKHTGYRTVSVLADVVGGDGWSGWLDVIERGGRFTCAGAIAGPMVQFDLRTFYLNDLTFTGATIVPVGIFADLVGYIERDEIAPLLAKTYPLSELHDAQRAFIAKKHVGNIVVLP